MAPDDPSGARPAAPVVLRIKLRYDDVDAMVQRFAPNVGKTGLFLPTKSLQPIGSELKFELRLANDRPVLVGHGRVKAAREPDPTNPKATFGMAVELLRVTRESRDLILKILDRRKQLGMPDIGIPMPADIESARRIDFLDTGVTAIPSFIPASDSAPSTTSSSGPVLTAPRRTSGPIAVAKEKVAAAVEPLAPEPPRRKRVPVADLIASASGPVVISTTVESLDDVTVDLAAALARARSLITAGVDLDSELASLRDAAAAPLESIDVEAASAELARQLGGAAVRRDRSGAHRSRPTNGKSGAIDGNGARADTATGHVPADARRADVAVETPPEEKPADAPADVPSPTDAASDVSARIEASDRASTFDVATGAAADAARTDARDTHSDELYGGADERAREDGGHGGGDDARGDAHALRGYVRDDSHADPHDVATPAESELPPTIDDDSPPDLFDRPSRRSFSPAHVAVKTEPSTPALIDDDADPAQFADDGGEDAHEVEPEQIHDEIHRLDDGDYEEVEHTQIGQMPVDPDAFERHAFATLPSEQAAIADRLDAALAAAEEEAAADDLGFTADAASADGGAHEMEEGGADYVIPLGGDGARADGGGDVDVYGTNDSLLAALDAAAQEVAQEDDEIEEIDDFEILAEADIEDDDLLQTMRADSGARAAGNDEEIDSDPVTERPPSRPSFLSRLELEEEESGLQTTRALRGAKPTREPSFSELSPEPGELDPRVLSAGYALRAFEDPDDAADFNAPGTFTPIPAEAPPYVEHAPSLGDESYTDVRDDEFDARHGDYALRGFVPPDAFDQSDVIAIGTSASGPQGVNPDDYDLETALEALDVDLDDLGAPHAARRATPVPVATGKSGRVHKRATTEDGIVIDFDDDDDDDGRGGVR